MRTVDSENMEPYKLLAMAIVERACKDYIKRYKFYLKFPCEATKNRLKELERFFYGKWYRDLCELDADILITQLKDYATNKKGRIERMRKYKYRIYHDATITSGTIEAKNMDEAYDIARKKGYQITGYGETGFLEAVTVHPIKVKECINEKV